MVQTRPPSQRAWPRGRAVLLAGAIVALTTLGGWRYWDTRTPVKLIVDGRERIVHTHASNAAALLADLGYVARPQDRVVSPENELTPGAAIVIERAQPVELVEAGGQRALWTRARTVREFFAEQGIVADANAIIALNGAAATLDTPLPAAQWQSPQRGLPHWPWEETAFPFTISIQRAVPVTVIDGDAAAATFVTTAATVAAALDEAGVDIYEGDEVFPTLSSRIQPGQRISIWRSLPITIQVDGATIATRTRQSTVGAALAEQGVTLVGLDRISAPFDAPLRAHDAIVVTRIREDVYYEQQPIAFETQWRADDALAIDTTRVEQAGNQGLLRRRFRVRYEDGVETARALEAEWTAQEPQTRVIAYGRLITPQTLETPDGVITYWRRMRVYANSYSPRRSGTPSTAAWYGRTRLGMQLQKGVIAVDPSVINLRQQMYVPGYGAGIAGDTGGGLLGKHIDLGFSDNDYVSWHRWVDIYLLWPPPAAHSIRYVLPNWPRFPDR